MSGDRLASLYRVYGPALYSRCHRLLGDRAAAEDATQETFMRVQRHLDKAPTSREALLWIYRIATHYCLNQIRNVQTRATPMEVLPEGEGLDAEGSLANRDLAARLIDRAPEKLRAVAWLHYVDGVDQGQVAQILCISRRTVLYPLGEFVRRARIFARRVEG